MNSNILTKNIISHRGIHDNKTVYENTLEAFKLALKKKYTIELDVHLTKDNQIIVFHDYNTKRITNKNQLIEKTSYKDLNNQNIIHIPTLKEVLKLVNGKVPLLIEIKQENKVGPLEQELMNILNAYQGEYAIQSFNVMTLIWFKKHYPNILRGQLSYNYKTIRMNKITKILLKNMFFNFLTKPNFISYKYNELSERKIKKYRKKGIILLAWTINNKNNYNKYKDIYDNLICEKII